MTPSAETAQEIKRKILKNPTVAILDQDRTDHGGELLILSNKLKSAEGKVVLLNERFTISIRELTQIQNVAEDLTNLRKQISEEINSLDKFLNSLKRENKDEIHKLEEHFSKPVNNDSELQIYQRKLEEVVSKIHLLEQVSTQEAELKLNLENVTKALKLVELSVTQQALSLTTMTNKLNLAKELEDEVKTIKEAIDELKLAVNTAKNQAQDNKIVTDLQNRINNLSSVFDKNITNLKSLLTSIDSQLSGEKSSHSSLSVSLVNLQNKIRSELVGITSATITTDSIKSNLSNVKQGFEKQISEYNMQLLKKRADRSVIKAQSFPGSAGFVKLGQTFNPGQADVDEVPNTLFPEGVTRNSEIQILAGYAEEARKKHDEANKLNRIKEYESIREAKLASIHDAKVEEANQMIQDENERLIAVVNSLNQDEQDRLAREAEFERLRQVEIQKDRIEQEIADKKQTQETQNLFYKALSVFTDFWKSGPVEKSVQRNKKKLGKRKLYYDRIQERKSFAKRQVLAEQRDPGSLEDFLSDQQLQIKKPNTFVSTGNNRGHLSTRNKGRVIKS